MPAPKQWTKEEKQDIIQSYKSGATATSIGLRYGTSHVTIMRWLTKEWGIPKRSYAESHRIHKYNPFFFDTIDTEEKAYWLGFIAADGCVVAPNRLSVSSRDKKHLQKLRECLNSTHKLYLNRSGSGSIAFQFTLFSTPIAKALAILGIHPRKSFTVKPSAINIKLERHYWRGVFDGDGCISPGHRRLTLVGNEYMLNGFREFCLRFVQTTANVRAHSSSSICQFAIQGKGAMRVLAEMYQSSSMYLDRKFLQYQSMESDVRPAATPLAASMKRENMVEERRPSRLAT